MTNPVSEVTLPSLTATGLAVLLRQLSLVMGSITAILGFLSSENVAGLWAYVQSQQFLTAIGAAGALAAFLYGQWRTLRLAGLPGGVHQQVLRGIERLRTAFCIRK